MFRCYNYVVVCCTWRDWGELHCTAQSGRGGRAGRVNTMLKWMAAAERRDLQLQSALPTISSPFPASPVNR